MCVKAVLEIKSVDVGVVAIRGLHSNYYLAISKKGDLYGAVSTASTQSSNHLYYTDPTTL